MGLTPREQQLLDASASDIYRSDTALAAFMLAFSQHASDEPMPQQELVTASRRHSAKQLRHRRRSLARRHAPPRRLAWATQARLRLVTALCLAVSVVAVATAASLSGGNALQRSTPPGCSVPFAACTGTPAHTAQGQSRLRGGQHRTP